MSRAYYNEWDPYAAQWLRNLINAGHIAPGDVDERSIVDVRADDLRGYTQCHFFAGIGGWSYALRLAGWPHDGPVWTGSCPCQPFSAAGKGKAGDDERHLWPRWFSLIKECGPAIVLGEQVEAAIGWGWLDLVFSDLEGEGYACGAAVLPACGVGAPHIRQRLWFVADCDDERLEVERIKSAWDQRAAIERSGETGELADDTIPRRNEQPQRNGGADGRPAQESGRLRDAGKLADGDHQGLEIERVESARDQRAPIERSGAAGELGNATQSRSSPEPQGRLSGRLPGGLRQSSEVSPWRDLQWLPCTDGKARPTQPGIFPLAHGVPARVGKLRGAGNAIVPQVCAEFIRAASGA